MGKEGLGWSDWNEIVERAENNIEVLKGNVKRAEIGMMLEKSALGIAKRERRKYPEPAPETMEDTEKPSEEAEKASEDETTSEDKAE